jgi:hypothetical protein
LTEQLPSLTGWNNNVDANSLQLVCRDRAVSCLIYRMVVAGVSTCQQLFVTTFLPTRQVIGTNYPGPNAVATIVGVKFHFLGPQGGAIGQVSPDNGLNVNWNTGPGLIAWDGKLAISFPVNQTSVSFLYDSTAGNSVNIVTDTGIKMGPVMLGTTFRPLNSPPSGNIAGTITITADANNLPFRRITLTDFRTDGAEPGAPTGGSITLYDMMFTINLCDALLVAGP